MKALMRKFMREESGQTFVEYALIISLIAIFLVIATLYLSGKIDTRFREVADCIANTSNCPEPRFSSLGK